MHPVTIRNFIVTFIRCNKMADKKGHKQAYQRHEKSNLKILKDMNDEKL